MNAIRLERAGLNWVLCYGPSVNPSAQTFNNALANPKRTARTDGMPDGLFRHQS